MSRRDMNMMVAAIVAAGTSLAPVYGASAGLHSSNSSQLPDSSQYATSDQARPDNWSGKKCSSDKLAGRYRFTIPDEDIVFDIHLNPDSSALYRIRTGERYIANAEGFWRREDGYIYIHNRPGPVTLELAEQPVRDPAVVLNIRITRPDGGEVKRLGITWPESRSLIIFADGQFTALDDDAEELAQAESFSIIRDGDNKLLQEIPLNPEGPNSFRFTYTPSDVEPFEFLAAPDGICGESLEAQFGIASARLNRIEE